MELHRPSARAPSASWSRASGAGARSRHRLSAPSLARRLAPRCRPPSARWRRSTWRTSRRSSARTSAAPGRRNKFLPPTRATRRRARARSLPTHWDRPSVTRSGILRSKTTSRPAQRQMRPLNVCASRIACRPFKIRWQTILRMPLGRLLANLLALMRLLRTRSTKQLIAPSVQRRIAIQAILLQTTGPVHPKPIAPA